MSVLVFVLLLASCGDGEAPADSGTGSVETGRTSRLTQDSQTVELCLLVADTPDERAVGLSGRESLEPFDGMIFDFEDVDRHGFWMKDTLVDLDLVPVLEDGTLGQPITMRTCPDGNCPSYRPDVAYGRAIEVPAGSLQDGGLDPTLPEPVGFAVTSESCPGP